MTSYSVKLNKTWELISDSEDYILQNRDERNGVIVKASDTEPTDTVGAFELNCKSVIASTILSGKIWARANSEDALIVYAK